MKILLATILLFFTATVSAADVYPSHSSYTGSIGAKLVRGLTNAVTGFVEIPREIDYVTHQKGIIHGATVGLVKGVAFAAGRHLTGAFDIAFFFVPSNSITRPIFVWDNWGHETSFNVP